MMRDQFYASETYHTNETTFVANTVFMHKLCGHFPYQRIHNHLIAYVAYTCNGIFGQMHKINCSQYDVEKTNKMYEKNYERVEQKYDIIDKSAINILL